MQIQNFDATGIAPQQVAGKHPEGMFPFQITNCFGQETKAKDGGMLAVEFTSPAGTIMNYYNLFNQNQQAREIAQKELSALCHATGVFKLTMLDSSGNVLPMNMWAVELKGARGTMKVRKQANSEYMEIEKIFDANGNEPGKGGAAAAPQTQGNANAAWGSQGQPQPNNASAGNSGGSWGQPKADPPAATGGAAAPPWAR